MKTSSFIRRNLGLLLTIIASIAGITTLNAQSIKRFIHDERDKLEWIMNGDTSTSTYELKHIYKYDSKERIKERETLYWEKRTQKWLPYYKTEITYEDNNTTIESSFWSWMTNQFKLDKKLINYTVNANEEILDYKVYSWDAIDKKWKAQKHHLLQYHYAENSY